ncbi:TetR/AcrR family transcriptional regulator [Cellulomonas soli]|uniref:HTH tetR-type domain-containing protein n=1 Tax=Cellulomonas soli TaxID=931535 RepID=A0A512PE75_9CELL|nr:TetR/AcrR family transcriptional regulator [Cellulomonas soli]NYI59029.1 AcrR family transcriptional regulator [Cellulomonas soli]GEP69478.1 hypothetical protein CSO01_21930 [Cellulomonas soli]
MRSPDPQLDQALIEAAVTELVQVGYARLTTAAVARRAGASTASLYRRWPSKHALVAEAATRLAEQALHPADTGSLTGDLTSLLQQKHAAVAGETGIALVSLVGQSAHDPELARTLHEAVFGLTRTHIATILDRAAARDELADGLDRDVFADLVIGAVLAPLVDRWSTDRDAADNPASLTTAAGTSGTDPSTSTGALAAARMLALAATR